MREPGFYWVRFPESKDWIVCEWWVTVVGADTKYAKWSRAGVLHSFTDSELAEIDERRIDRNASQRIDIDQSIAWPGLKLELCDGHAVLKSLDGSVVEIHAIFGGKKMRVHCIGDCWCGSHHANERAVRRIHGLGVQAH